MGAQWKHAGRIENSNKRGAMISKLVKEITVATKAGDPNPENNSRLRVAIEDAKKHSVPRDTIERAIKKGAGLLAGENQYESVFYEGFAPHRVPLIVECLTDNKNRTAAEIRVLFRKGHLESIGSVTWMFDRLGIIEATFAKAGVDSEEAAIEAGAQNVEALEGDLAEGQTGARFYCDPTDLDKVTKALAQFGWTIRQSEIGFMAKSRVSLSDEQMKEVTDFLNAIDDDEDVHRVYAGI